MAPPTFEVFTKITQNLCNIVWTSKAISPQAMEEFSSYVFSFVGDANVDDEFHVPVDGCQCTYTILRCDKWGYACTVKFEARRFFQQPSTITSATVELIFNDC